MTEEDYEQAVLMHKDRVHAYTQMMLRDTGEAQDAAQEALVRLWQHRASVDREGARAWLVRTAHNLCIDGIRCRRTRAEVDDGDAVVEHRPLDAPGPEQLTAAGRLGGKIQQALGKLTNEDRAVLVMREVQGLPYQEIAEALNLPLGTLKARLHRARERLRARLTRAGVTP